MSSGSIRIIQLPEKSSVNTDDYMAVDSSANGTKKVKFTDLLDNNLSAQNKAADAQATGEAINDISARVDNMINTQTNASVTTLWTGRINLKNETANLSESINNFDFIDVYCGGADTVFARQHVSGSSVHFELQSQNMSDDASVQFMRWWETGLTISGTTATITKAIKCFWDDFSTVPVVSQATGGGVDIIRIDGVKIGHVENDEIIDARVGANGTTYPTLGGAIRGQVTDLKADLYPRMKAVDGQYAISKADFDIGNIQITNSGWNYNDWNDRVRTKQGCEIHLNVGDVIHFTDYTTVKYYLGWKKADDTYGSQGWLTSDFTVTVEGDYVFLITTVPEVSQTSVDALVSRLTITSADSMKADLMTLDSQVSKDDIRTKAVREGIVYTTAGHHDLYLYAGETVDINVTALSSRTNAYINTDSSYSIPIDAVGKYTFTARTEGYLANYAFGASDFSMNMEVCLRTRYDDALDAIHADDTSYYTVDVNGNGDYTSFTACIEALESDSSKKVITILEGDYDIYTELGGSAYVDSLSGNDWRSANAIVPPNTIIKGIGDVNLLYLPDTAAEVGKTLISPLNLSGTVEVHNVNIHCKNCRYAIHLEGSAISDFDNANILLDNVNIVRDEGLYARQVLGCGLNKGCTLIVKNCTWENTNSNTFYVHTNSLVEHPRIVVENCQFITHGTSGFYLSSENKVHDGEVLVRLNSVYADNANIIKADIQNGDCFRVVANGCNLLTQSTFNTGYLMNSLDQYLTIS